MLRQHAVAFTEHIYDYVEHGGTAESARQLGVDEHAVVKTRVMQDQDAKPLPIYVECSVLAMPAIYINAGRRGCLVCITSKVLRDLLNARPVDCAAPQYSGSATKIVNRPNHLIPFKF